ncbi:hypothetical protein GCM10023321_26210 [Pseudonocardia eucalypti]|uniref:Helicase HerA central domain-containing protein n=1 Tax=Pseudonocardia eucalypti TaxID=648755 RepID=A0ABP9PYQ3_9PSEU|nr:hypothetical protein [Pseudonocardia eucalypti]
MKAYQTLVGTEGPDGCLLGHTGEGSPVYLGAEHRTAHVALIGKTRFGKTTVLEHLIRDDLIAGTGTIVLDPHGDLATRIVEVAPPEALERITVVELGMGTSFGLNLYESPHDDSLNVDRVVGNVIEVFKKLFLDERNFYPVIDEGLRNSAYVVIANGHTLNEVPLLFTDRHFLQRSLHTVTNSTVLSFWEEYQGLPPRERREVRWPVLNKVNRFLGSDAIRYMVAQQKTTVPFDGALDRGQCLIFRLSGDVLDRDTADFLGMAFLANLGNAVARRAGRSTSARPRVHVYLDEYGRFATRTTDRMLEEFGKYEIGMTVAHQNLERVGGRPASAASLIMFQLDGEDAPRMSLHLDTTPKRTKRVVKLRTVPEYENVTHTEWESADHETQYRTLTKLTEAIEAMLAVARRRLELFRTGVEMRRECASETSCPCGCGDHMLARSGDATKYISSMLGDWRGYIGGNKQWAIGRTDHMLFNPRRDYFAEHMVARVRSGETVTVGGLRTLAKLPKSWHRGWKEAEKHVYEVYRLPADAADHAWLVVGLKEHAKRFAQGKGDREWLEGIADELCTMLRTVYEEKNFFMRATPLSTDDVERNGPKPPAQGTERDGTYPRWPGSHWAVTDFKEGIGWLILKTFEIARLRDRASALLDEKRQEADEFRRKHERVWTEKVLRGHKAVRDTERTTRPAIHFVQGREREYQQIHISEPSVYDEIEELDQTHADRAAEIATELSSLPKYVAYCKLLDQNGNPHEYRVTARKPAESIGAHRLTEVTSRSLQQYARAWSDVQREIDARRNPSEPAGPPITRRPRR